MITAGLSPRVRGNHGRTGRSFCYYGSIPARAGEPYRSPCQSCRCRVYPRACGGTEAYTITAASSTGLSPRVRGNQGPTKGAAVRAGSIPARAGEPANDSPASSAAKVYPRACGGTACSTRSLTTALGLSPRVRGNPPAAGSVATGIGSIPARAGEPRPRYASVITPRVYPRACGGTLMELCTASLTTGLSPRVRGNRNADRRERR